jgi:hypothetical protein
VHAILGSGERGPGGGEPVSGFGGLALHEGLPAGPHLVPGSGQLIPSGEEEQ